MFTPRYIFIYIIFLVKYIFYFFLFSHNSINISTEKTGLKTALTPFETALTPFKNCSDTIILYACKKKGYSILLYIMITLQINGTVHITSSELLSDLIIERGYLSSNIIVSLNSRIIQKSSWSLLKLNDNDNLYIAEFTDGG